MRALRSVLTAALFSASLAARADTFQTFSFSATTLTGTVSGTIDLDLDANLYTDHGVRDSTANVVYSTNGHSTVFSGRNGGFGVENLNATFLIFAGQSESIFDLALPLNTGVLAGYSGGPICSVANACGESVSFLENSAGKYVPIETGSLTPLVLPTTAPEPSSIALLGTGLLCLAGVVRRRL